MVNRIRALGLSVFCALALCATPFLASPAHGQAATYNSTAPTLSNKDRTELQADVNGSLKVSPSGNVAHDAVDSGAPVKIGGKSAYTPCTAVSGAGDRVDACYTLNGGAYVALVDKNGNVFDAGVLNSSGISASGVALPIQAFGFIFNGTTWDQAKKPNSTGRLLSAAATTNSTNVKASAGDLFLIRGYTAKASAIFLKLYNKATAPTCGTDTPVMTFRLEASQPFEIRIDGGPYYFSTGIGYCITGAAADADTTALVAGDVVAMNVIYQ